ncbi:hypothetical protein [Desertivirga arenae]|uniref:hypothetical protein n=1 Tax=Desertivirga arenae TaxID=2810309 RepID=UPI001A96C3C3|nr:hypothetical protein [Pedobacter sp. SYSU D00823]
MGESEFSFTQIQLAEDLNKVEVITFREINTPGLFATLNGSGSLIPQASQPVYRKQTYFAPPEPRIQTITETFYVPIKNIQFRQGGVFFRQKLKEHRETLDLIISNPEIFEEFDAVKNYFANVLGTRKIEVTVEVETKDYAITSVKVRSPEIARIDKQLIEQVRLEFVKSTMSKKTLEGEKSLFTAEEYLDTFADENVKPDTFHKSDQELFEDLLTISNTKHYKHLRFLSSKHDHATMKLRFVPKPFSFVFLLEGKINYHIVWETLNTEEATYVWDAPKGDKKLLKATLGKIDHIINQIKAKGKLLYLITTEDSFKRIYHDYSESVDGFLKWKTELENVIN